MRTTPDSNGACHYREYADGIPSVVIVARLLSVVDEFQARLRAAIAGAGLESGAEALVVAALQAQGFLPGDADSAPRSREEDVARLLEQSDVPPELRASVLGALRERGFEPGYVRIPQATVAYSVGSWRPLA